MGGGGGGSDPSRKWCALQLCRQTICVLRSFWAHSEEWSPARVGFENTTLVKPLALASDPVVVVEVGVGARREARAPKRARARSVYSGAVLIVGRYRRSRCVLLSGVNL